MERDLLRVLLTEKDIQTRIKELGREITRDYVGRRLHLVSVLKGSVTFLTDLMRAIDLPLTIDFMAVSSYGQGVKTSGVVQVIKDLSDPLEGKDVLIVEDVLDTGLTLTYITELLQAKDAASIKVCALLNKPGRRHPSVTIAPDYEGFVIPDEFVVGYGLDYAELYRNLPYIGVLDPRVYKA
ncbi:MAG: hypoxanthine phosphoribosyltransferase [Clostridiales bacterium]|nr:hypoxanthine phosphoribosyltransferase [Clostridiales bacterium]